MTDVYIDSVVYLANYLGSDGDTTYTPEVGDTVDFYGNAELQNTTTLFGNTTAYVDGTGDYLDTGVVAELDFLHTNDQDFTIEQWVRFPDVTNAGYTLATRDGGYGVIMGIGDGGKLQCTIYDNVGAVVELTEAGTSVSIDTWYFISVTRTGGAGTGSYEIKLDNVSKATDTYGTVETGSHAGILTFGKTAGASSFREIEAYFGPTRITQGVARTIAVPSDIFELGVDAYFSSVVSLLNFEDMGDGTTITDTAPVAAPAWTANNGAAVSSGVLVLDGTDDYISQAFDADFADEFDGTNSSAWTIELKYKVGSTTSGAQPLFDWRDGFTSKGIAIRQPTSPTTDIRLGVGDATSGWEIDISAVSVLALDDNVEIALTRTGDDYLLHVNGIYINKGTEAATLGFGATGVQIGVFTGSGADYLEGDFYRLRMTKDIARYGEVDYAPPPGNRYPEPPYISDQPTAQQVAEDTVATFTVTAAGVTSYQWYELTDGLIGGETASTLDFTAVLADNGNSYYCELTNTDGIVNTDTVGLTVLETLDAYIEDTGPLGQPNIVIFNDFAALATDTQQFYEMDITGTPILNLPISSWQATKQSDQANYAQCVIPNVTDYVTEITARQGVEEFIIYKVTEINGIEVRSEMVRSPVETVNFSQGAFNSTATMSGYTDPIPVTVNPVTRVMVGIRTDSTSGTGKRRVRCDVDWYLVPGDDANVLGDDFTVVYINYFVPTSGDIYMDIGDR